MLLALLLILLVLALVGGGWGYSGPGYGYWSFSPFALIAVILVVLLLFGAHDERVPSVASASAIRTTLTRQARRERRNITVTVKFYPDADHTFTIVDPPHKDGWPRREPGYADTITHWVTSLR